MGWARFYGRVWRPKPENFMSISELLYGTGDETGLFCFKAPVGDDGEEVYAIARSLIGYYTLEILDDGETVSTSTKLSYIGSVNGYAIYGSLTWFAFLRPNLLFFCTKNCLFSEGEAVKWETGKSHITGIDDSQGDTITYGTALAYSTYVPRKRNETQVMVRTNGLTPRDESDTTVYRIKRNFDIVATSDSGSQFGKYAAKTSSGTITRTYVVGVQKIHFSRDEEDSFDAYEPVDGGDSSRPFGDAFHYVEGWGYVIGEVEVGVWWAASSYPTEDSKEVTFKRYQQNYMFDDVKLGDFEAEWVGRVFSEYEDTGGKSGEETNAKVGVLSFAMTERQGT